jgi:hypothetical protein
VESEPRDFLSTYETLYQKLKHGEKLMERHDHKLTWLCTGITGHLENCQYRPTARLAVRDFAEPCPIIETFCFTPWRDQLSTSFGVHQFPENICGLTLYFPKKVEYLVTDEKHPAGILPDSALEDFNTYQLLLSRIQAVTKPLKLEFNGKIRRTAVRISSDAKKDLENFYFISSHQIRIL